MFRQAMVFGGLILGLATTSDAAFKTMASGKSTTSGSYWIGGFWGPITMTDVNEKPLAWDNGSGAAVGLAASGQQKTEQLIRPTNSHTDLPVSWLSQGQTAGSGFAEPGRLHAQASASALMNPTVQNLDYEDAVDHKIKQYEARNPFWTYAHTEISVGWEDTITITSDTLAPGKWVNVELNVALDSIMNNPRNTPNNGVGVSFYAIAPSGTTSLFVSGKPNGDTAAGKRLWSFQVGETITLRATMNLAAFARAGYNIDPLASGVIVPNDAVSVDASNTGHFYFDIDPAVNASVVSSSGYDYSITAPVPEPASLVLLAATAALGLTRRRR